MIELRWVNITKTNRQLEYRWRKLATDASGALCPTDEWSHWQVVKSINGDDAAYEDLRASGGIVGAP